MEQVIDVTLAPYGSDPSTGQPYPPHPTQQKIIDWCRAVREGRSSSKGIPVAYIQHGVNSGGTRAVLTPMLEYLLEQAGLNCLIGRKDFTDLRVSGMETFFRIVPPELLVEQNAQEHRYVLRAVNGTSTVFFRELKDVGGLGSQEFAVIVVIEAHELTLTAYRTLKQRCRQGLLPSFILLEGNPPGEGHWLTKLSNPLDPDYDADLTLFKLTSYENWEHMHPAYRTSLETMPPSWQKRYLLGEVGALPSGTPVYPSFVETVHSKITHLIPERPLLRAWDFGWRRAACVWAQQAANGQLLVHREWMCLEKPEHEFIAGVKQRTKDWFGDRVCQDMGDPAARNRDPEGVTTLNRLQEAGITLQFRQTTYAERIPLINQRFSLLIDGSPAIVLNAGGCPILIEALMGGYHYPELKPDTVMTEKTQVPMKEGWFEHCLAGETRLRTLHGYVPIKDLVNQPPCWVWGYSAPEKRMVPGRLTRVWRVGVKPVLVLKHDGGQLVATGDHPICLRDGRFVRLDELQPGDELMPFYETRHSRGKSRKGDHWYRWVWLNDGSEGYEHRIVYGRLQGHLRHKFNVDHRDGNVENNEPDNLQLLSSAAHAAKTRSWTRGQPHKTLRPCKVCGTSFEAWTSGWCSSRCRARYRLAIAPARWKVPTNHRVVSVEPYGTTEVYDFTVEGIHNAVAEGIVVHNCANAFEYLCVNRFLDSPPALTRFLQDKQAHRRRQQHAARGVVRF